MQALRAFEAAARTQSLTRAAETLNLTHGAISHQIKSLEAALGVRLIERAGRGIRVTEEGERFAARLRAALAEIADAVREASERSNPRQLRVSVMPSFAARWLLPRLGSFHRAAHGHRSRRPLEHGARRLPARRRRRRDSPRLRQLAGRQGRVPDGRRVLSRVQSAARSTLPARPRDLARHTLLRSDDESWKPWFEAVGLDWPEPARGPIFNDSR